ncbi:MAG: sensor histidine kinase N-terminal domain-containing protein [Rhodoferax sp.]|uniref:sensor histidine kinase n=1 Tax=Rhodoferax sp. TaxID=50421 RepID=UPI002ACD72C7|nr:sensor histidine kinase N-terminal domain-containing protein [Rhodoferax sp.]MDZ7892064.1 sensor histidine kinase N-terminal domain-containing protein [Rhodoferax sp.]
MTSTRPAATAADKSLGPVLLWIRGSIRRKLLLVLLPGLLLVFSAELWLASRTASEAADAAYDRSLLGAVKSIDSSISTASGGLGVELPYRMLKFFELTANGQVYYRVATEDGLVEIGSSELPLPPKPLLTGIPQFHEGVYFGEPVRVGSYARELTTPLAGQSTPQRVVVQVAETLEARTDFRRGLILNSVARDFLLVAVATTLFGLTIAWAMRPLARMRQDVEARAPRDLTPMRSEGVPAELLPLVGAINHHIQRNREQTEARRQFVDDASHQLRTPLTTLATQVAYAQRAADPVALRTVMDNIRQQLDETIRQTNQMLSLAKADSAAPELETLDAVVLAEDMVRRWWPVAREQGVDLGLQAPDAKLRFQGEPGLLKEALSNLLHNAIRHGGTGCHVTLAVVADTETVRFSVVDDGPGLPADELARAGERFFRGHSVQVQGSGLGLAIARTVAQRHGGALQVSGGPEGRGLAVSITLARAGETSMSLASGYAGIP